MNKKFITLLMAIALTVNIVGCTARDTKAAITQNTSLQTTATQVEVEEAQNVSDAQILSAITVSTGESVSVGKADTVIVLDNNNISIEGTGATVKDNKVTITDGGTYSIKGTLADGQIIVDAGDDDKVYMILDGVNITCSNSAPIYIKNAKKAIISLAENTKNYITDGKTYVFEDTTSDEPNAAIFSKTDLIITGNGALTVDANYNNGIVSKDDLKIESGNITVSAKSDGIRGKDSVVITNGIVTIDAGGDGIKSNNDKNTEKGYALIEGGKITINALEDGIQGETNVFVKAGELSITTGGGSINGATKVETMGRPGMTQQATTTDTESDVSSKGIKAGVNIVIEGGTFNIDAADDAIHSNNNIVIHKGVFNLSSGDDAIHSDTTLTINGGDIDITKSYEGIESETITINGGNINIIASDDGINAAGGNDGLNVDANSTGLSTMGGPGGRGGGFGGASSTGMIHINGGYITVDANGDGIDSNGSIYMKGGTVIVNGPTTGADGYLDYDSIFEMTGGFLVAAGSSGMAQATSSTSTQNAIRVNLTTQSANTLVRIESERGEEILTFAPTKQFSSVLVSSPEIKTGSTYKVYIGGSSTGTAAKGIYAQGSYTKGTEVGSVTISSLVSQVTQEGATASGGGGGRGGMRDSGEMGNLGERGNPGDRAKPTP